MSRITEAVRAEQELITPDDVAEWLKVTKDWLYDQVQTDRIPYVRVGRRLRFRVGDIEAYLSGEWQPPAAAKTTEDEQPEPVRRRGGRPRKN